MNHGKHGLNLDSVINMDLGPLNWSLENFVTCLGITEECLSDSLDGTYIDIYIDLRIGMFLLLNHPLRIIIKGLKHSHMKNNFGMNGSLKGLPLNHKNI